VLRRTRQAWEPPNEEGAVAGALSAVRHPAAGRRSDAKAAPRCAKTIRRVAVGRVAEPVHVRPDITKVKTRIFACLRGGRRSMHVSRKAGGTITKRLPVPEYDDVVACQRRAKPGIRKVWGGRTPGP